MERITERIGEAIEFSNKERFENLSPKELTESLLKALADYEDLGTAEDIEITIEKKKAKAPIMHMLMETCNTYFCSQCGEIVSKRNNYCNICGLKIGWEGASE